MMNAMPTMAKHREHGERANLAPKPFILLFIGRRSCATVALFQVQGYFEAAEFAS